MNRIQHFLGLIAAFTILAACQAAPVPGPTPLTALPTSAPTLPVVSTQVSAPQPTPQVAPQPQTKEPPVRYTFPTPGAVAASLWRPPLYDTPWALNPNDHFYFKRPIAVDEVNWPEPDYRYGGLAEGKKLAHSGVDIAAPRNTPVYASAPGRVVWVGYGLSTGMYDPDDPYGLAVAIDHDFGFNGYRLSTVSAHLDRIDVTFGQRVEAGTLLGVVGTTGNTTGPHLHFEVRLKIGDFYSSRNPELWLAPSLGWGVLVGKLAREDGSPIIRQLVNIRNTQTRQIWQLHSYGPNNTHPDDYYDENLVISDLPAGEYEISFEYEEQLRKLLVIIHPGAVTYFSYREGRGFNTALPPTPSPGEWLATPKGQK